MSGFDPLGFRATNWRVVGLRLLRMIIFLPLIVGGVIFFGEIKINPDNHSKAMRIGADIFFILLIAGAIAGKIWNMLHTVQHVKEIAAEGERVIGEFNKIIPVSQQEQLHQQKEQ